MRGEGACEATGARRAHRQQALQRHRVEVDLGRRGEGQAQLAHAHLQPRGHSLLGMGNMKGDVGQQAEDWRSD